ncbi:cupin domain-containing protein [Actinoalloteichus caeruleus]|uniref:Monooxygenase n=1 Tax=Actinoalloteichus caeruleus DSM 43889 TaxID=1120930 RepID=A0ABT1JFG2_ACTCY|nr:cupin domain-containing protein [Actinoalloteichus caeruleus]MCP2331238.1 putative monooxygenase [Actinoalloteichus caeruleus DSM 43889]
MRTTGPLKVNVADAVVNRRRGGEIRVTLSPRTVGATSGFGGELRLAPHEYVTEHYHPYSEEFIHLVSGELAVSLDDEVTTLGPGDSLLVPIGVRHRVTNTGTAPAHVVFHLGPLAPRPELGHVDTEPLANPDQPHMDVGDRS